MTRSRRITQTLVAALASAALAATPAAADTEPNNGLGQWEGPLNGSSTYAGTLSGDEDWYGFYVLGEALLEIPLTLNTPNCTVQVSLLDTNGSQKTATAMSSAGTQTLFFSNIPFGGPTNANIVTRYYLVWKPSGGCAASYSFRFQVPSLITSGEGPPQATATSEPNDSSSPFGPIGGGTWYSGTLDSLNDEDVVSFRTVRPGRLDLEVENLGPGDTPISATLIGENSGQVGNGRTLVPARNIADHLVVDLPGPARYTVHILPQNSVGTVWLLRLTPAELIEPPPPIPTVTQVVAAPVLAPTAPAIVQTQTVGRRKSAKCISAEKRYRAYTKSVSRWRAKVRKAKTRKAKRSAQKKLRSVQKKRSSAAITIAKQCK